MSYDILAQTDACSERFGSSVSNHVSATWTPQWLCSSRLLGRRPGPGQQRLEVGGALSDPSGRSTVSRGVLWAASQHQGAAGGLPQGGLRGHEGRTKPWESTGHPIAQI